MFGGFNIYLVGAIALMAAGGFGYFKYTESVKETLRSQITTLMINEKVLTDAIDTQVKTIASLEEERDRIRKDFEETEQEFAIIRSQNLEFADRLKNLNLEESAITSPAATQNLINDISKKMNRCAELISGAPLNDKEKNAKTAEEFNSECTWMYKQ